jgi:light-regulated signal transduction histidine kinase (bacteriophytochrome)
MTHTKSQNLELDLDACAAEPIRIPGGVQPHGALIVLAPDWARILQASDNAQAFLGLASPSDPQAVLGALANAGFDLADLDGSAPRVAAVTLPGGRFHLSAHRTAQGALLEFESAAADLSLDALYPRIRRVLDRLADAVEVAEIARIAVEELHELTGFNRVLLYSFDAQGDGTVLAEATDGVLPSYLNLRFPAGDIPAQARELYKLNRIRLIPNADYRPAVITPALNPLDGQPLDLGQAALRSVSPIHLEYMQNMGTAASMSISILVNGELWGLISAHNRAPRQMGPQLRAACDHIGQMVSLQIAAREQARRTAERLRLSDIRVDLLARLGASEDYARGLASEPQLWGAVAGGAGAALVREAEVIAIGAAPPADMIRELARELFTEGRASFFTESLAETWPQFASVAPVASGLAAVAVSQLHPHYLMWFRPEVVRTVEWAGEPAKPAELGDRLHPRKSFELWKQQVRLKATPWSPEEAESATAFRAAIHAFVLRRAEERAELTTRLAAANAELESFSYSISHDLRAPFRHVVGFADLLAERNGADFDETSQRYLVNIRDAALSAGRLVDDLLAFSQLGRNSLRQSSIDMNRLVAEVRRSLSVEPAAERLQWRVETLPPAWGDAAMIRQVWQNLLSNALKYSAGQAAPRVEVSGEDLLDRTRYVIRDNGVGFDMAYAHKLFAVFQRLHRADEFEGDGIGLALVRRIIERHGGEVRAHGELGVGATFTFELLKPPRRAAPGDLELG